MRYVVVGLLALVAVARADDAVLSTGITGSVTAKGVDDPQYALSFVAIQKLVLAAASKTVTRADVEAAVKGTSVTVEKLVELGLIAKDGSGYRTSYLLLTVDDQRAIYGVAAKRGASLADAFRAHAKEFAKLMAGYDTSLRDELLFDLIAGVSLNWDGLRVASSLGYRVQPVAHGKGGTYIVHSAELGAKLDLTGLYLDSESAPGGKLVFATFGDGPSMPRLAGLPDAFGGIESATEAWKSRAAIYGALQKEYLALALEALGDAGTVLASIDAGNDTDEALAKALSIPAERRAAIVNLLVSLGYLREADRRYRIAVPVVLARHKQMADDVLALGRQIITSWLQANHDDIAKELAGLSPMKNGLSFSLVFSEVWHYTFGFATQKLAEGGFYANPHARTARFPGYEPLVFDATLIAMPE